MADEHRSAVQTWLVGLDEGVRETAEQLVWIVNSANPRLEQGCQAGQGHVHCQWQLAPLALRCRGNQERREARLPQGHAAR